MRLFVAACLPPDLREALAETSALLRGTVRGRYVAADSFHATLAFLGNVDGWRVDDAAFALRCGCAGTAPIDVLLGELGSFGRRSSATLWQGLRSDDGALEELAQSVRAELAAADFSFDGKAFLPHVTLMRAADLRQGTLPSPALARGTIREVALFSSDLSGDRPQYEPLETVGL